MKLFCCQLFCEFFFQMCDCDVLMSHQVALYEELLKKEGEITALKAKALQLIRNHEQATGYEDMRQELQQLGNKLPV